MACDRRSFLGMLAGAVVLGSAGRAMAQAASAADSTGAAAAAGKGAGAVDTSAADALGWQVGVQVYTFNHYTLSEALDKAAGLGVKVVELYPGQKLGLEGFAETPVGVDMGAEAEKKVLEKLAQTGLKAACFGVVTLGADEAENRKTFEFAKRMGMTAIASEPEQEHLPAIDKLAREYGIKVAIHNHPKPSRYWDPKVVKAALEGLSPMVGSCSDTGHWMRSGIDPLEALKMLEGRIVELHFKDLNERSPEAHDVPWGEGKLGLPAILAELKRQKFRGNFMTEYEHNWTTSVPEIAQCYANFHKAAAELA